MTETPKAAVEYYASVRNIALRLSQLIGYVWLGVGADFSRTFPIVERQVSSLMTAAQAAVLRQSNRYVPNVVNELGIGSDAQGEINPKAFVGVSARGLPVSRLIGTTGDKYYEALETGVEAYQASQDALHWLEQISINEIQATAAAATGINTVLEGRVKYYVRMLNPPSCARCALLAGRVYKSAEAFERHPNCNCIHIPSSEAIAGDFTTDPHAYFESLDEADQDRIFTKAGAQAIRDGGDIFQVVNARRGIRRHANGDSYTIEGTYVGRGGRPRGVFAKQNARMAAAGAKDGLLKYRMTPEAIYRKASSKQEAVELLRRYAYILP